MGIEIASAVNNKTGMEILPSFVLDHPTIGHLRIAFGGAHASATLAESSSSDDLSPASTPRSTPLSIVESSLASNTPPSDRILEKHEPVLKAAERKTGTVPPQTEDNSPVPSARVTLMQGRPSSGKQAFYLIADGTGSVATYIHLPQFKSKMPVYGIDSPYLRCPDRLVAHGGIPAVANGIVNALVKSQPEGPFFIGGFSP